MYGFYELEHHSIAILFHETIMSDLYRKILARLSNVS